MQQNAVLLSSGLPAKILTSVCLRIPFNQHSKWH